MKNLLHLFIFLGCCSLLGQVSKNEQEYNGCKYLEEANYIINKTQVYFENCAIHRKVDVLPEALVLLGNGLAHDGIHIFFNGIKLAVAPDDLKLVYSDGRTVFWSNKGILYKNNLEIAHIDSRSFEVLKAGYFKDANQVFYLGTKIKEADAKTFVFNNEFSFDANYVYQKDRKIKKNGYLKAVNGHFYKDDVQVYKKDNSYETDDFMPVKTIKIQDTKALVTTKYGQVNDTLYFLDKSTGLTNVTFDAVRILSSDLLIYNNMVIYRGFETNELDANSLTFVKPSYYAAIVQDKSGTFRMNIGSVGGEPDKIQFERIAAQNSEQEVPDAYQMKTKLFADSNQLYLNMQPVLDKKVLVANDFIDFTDIEVVSVLKGYRMGCSQDTAPNSNFYIVKNKRGYWKLTLSAENAISYIGETYQF